MYNNSMYNGVVDWEVWSRCMDIAQMHLRYSVTFYKRDFHRGDTGGSTAPIHLIFDTKVRIYEENTSWKFRDFLPVHLWVISDSFRRCKLRKFWLYSPHIYESRQKIRPRSCTMGDYLQFVWVLWYMVRNSMTYPIVIMFYRVVRPDRRYYKVRRVSNLRQHAPVVYQHSPQLSQLANIVVL